MLVFTFDIVPSIKESFMGIYKDRKEAENRHKTPMQIRTNKNQQSKSRNTERKLSRIATDKERYEPWRSLTLEQQLTKLDKEQPTGATNQKDKIRAKLAKQRAKQADE